MPSKCRLPTLLRLLLGISLIIIPLVILSQLDTMLPPEILDSKASIHIGALLTMSMMTGALIILLKVFLPDKKQ